MFNPSHIKINNHTGRRGGIEYSKEVKNMGFGRRNDCGCGDGFGFSGGGCEWIWIIIIIIVLLCCCCN